MIQLEDHQIYAVEKMHNGCILKGGTGSGKTLTSLVYIFEKVLKGETPIYPGHTYHKPTIDIPIYVITTPRKRDDLDWIKEASYVPLKLTKVDSWNNIKKYEFIKDAFFIFDETKVVRYGAWTKSFLKITKNNKWVLLSATPADTWIEFMPVFIANGYYRNKTEFEREHVVWCRFTKYPKVDRYLNVAKLIRLRDEVLVRMYFQRNTIPHHIDILCDYDEISYDILVKDRWDIYQNKPIRDASQLCYLLRKLINSDLSRYSALDCILQKHSKVIIFYNYDYELDLLRNYCKTNNIIYSEWNGHKHEEIPNTDSWIYLCQYMAAQEAWNCVLTNCIVFYSQTYSYKSLTQASGRIDRINTPFIDLYYYHLISDSNIDLSIRRALDKKENFNENRYLKSLF